MSVATVWLYYELSADGQVTSGQPGEVALTIDEHLVEVPQGAFANDLLRQVVFHRTDPVGRLLPPAYAYRLATEREVAAYQALKASERTIAEVAASGAPITEQQATAGSTEGQSDAGAAVPDPGASFPEGGPQGDAAGKTT